MSNSDDVDGYTMYVCTGIYIKNFRWGEGGGKFSSIKKKKKANKRHFRSYLMMSISQKLTLDFFL